MSTKRLRVSSKMRCSSGYERRDNAKSDRELVFNPTDVLAFLRATQSRAWDEFSKIHGPEVEKKLLFRLTRELDQRGMFVLKLVGPDSAPLQRGLVDFGCFQ